MFNKKPIIWAFKDPNNKFNKEKLKAIQIFEKLSNRRKHKLKFKLNSGDMLIYNNFKVLHGREKFIKKTKKEINP